MSRKDPAGYEWHGYRIPARMAGGINRWIKHGVLPGDFLNAVLRNDLRGALERADEENIDNLPAYVAYLYNEAPAPCWGSPEKVDAWMRQAGEEGV